MLEAVENSGETPEWVFCENDRVQLQTANGKTYTVTIQAGKWFNANRVSFRLDELIGVPEGSVIRSREGREILAMRPLLTDHVLSMPRGAAIIYPKDCGQIVRLADIRPGQRILEAGVGSGALTMHLLNALAGAGELHSYELREDFAQVAAANVRTWFKEQPSNWHLHLEDVAHAGTDLAEQSVNRVLLDMLEPWLHIETCARVLQPGGVLVAYVATVPQLSRLCEELRKSERFMEPQSSEFVQRNWHVQGLAVRPEHEMIGHTGFLVFTRVLAPGSRPIRIQTRPAKMAEGKGGQWNSVETWDEQATGQKVKTRRKIRQVLRDAEGGSRRYVQSDEPSRIRQGGEE
ncbi:MAG: tRNA (adenine-N1)-methyltransferase [Varibaculum sp.]|nr:tRNA (adenine-N1)-methyltransferase [Varibaculum sp.]